MCNYIFQDYNSIYHGLRSLFAINNVGRFCIWMRLMFYFYKSKNRIIRTFCGGICKNHILTVYSSDISPYSRIGKAIFPHPIGIVIGNGVIIGNNVKIFQNVTIGQLNGAYPKLEDDVKIYASCIVIGPITLSKGTIVGANSLLLSSTEPNSVYAGSPAKRIR